MEEESNEIGQEAAKCSTSSEGGGKTKNADPPSGSPISLLLEDGRMSSGGELDVRRRTTSSSKLRRPMLGFTIAPSEMPLNLVQKLCAISIAGVGLWCWLNAIKDFFHYRSREQKIKTFFEGEDIRRLDSKVVCTFSDSTKTGKANGSQFKADISVKAHAGGSKVEVIVDLPFLLTPIKGKVQETIQRKLAKHLA